MASEEKDEDLGDVECEKHADGYWVLKVKLVPEKPGLVTVYAAQAAGFAHAASRLCDMVSSGFIAESGRRDTLMRANSMFAAGLHASIEALKALGPETHATEQKSEGAK